MGETIEHRPASPKSRARGESHAAQGLSRLGMTTASPPAPLRELQLPTFLHGDVLGMLLVGAPLGAVVDVAATLGSGTEAITSWLTRWLGDGIVAGLERDRR